MKKRQQNTTEIKCKHRENNGSNTKYQKLDWKVKHSCREDKKDWLEQKGIKAQETASEMMLFYVIRALTGY